MLFKPFTAAQYRALDDDAFDARRKEVNDLINSGELPEGITVEDLSKELDMIESERSLRGRLATERRNAAAEAVASGEGTVVAASEETRAMPRNEVSFSARSREVSENFTDSKDYRTALAMHIMHREQMPPEYVMRAYQEYRANTPVSMNADFTNMTDPTFQNTISSLIVVPSTLSEEVQKELRETAVLYPKVNVTNYQGQLAVSEYDLQVTGAWIGDKEVSPYQEDYDPEVFTWAWHQFEARFARTMLAQALMSDTYVRQLAPALSECYATAIDTVVYAGTGVGQPRGITNDLRLVGSDGKGLDSTLTSYYTQRTGTGKGRALIIEVNSDQIDDWKFWSTILYNTKFNRLYRGKGELIIADGTWGNHVNVLHDDNNRPIALMNPLAEEQRLSLRGVGPVDTLPNGIMKSFDDASVGDVIGIYGNFKNYTINQQPGMPLTTVSWEDHETNTHKTKMLTALDGRVSNPFGWVILKKGPEA